MGFIVSFVAAAALAATTPDPASPQAGRALASRSCGGCHAIGARGASPHGKAPPFRQVMQRKSPDDLRQALTDSFFVAHPVMPKFVLKPEEVEGLIAYLTTLKR